MFELSALRNCPSLLFDHRRHFHAGSRNTPPHQDSITPQTKTDTGSAFWHGSLRYCGRDSHQSLLLGAQSDILRLHELVLP